MSDSPRPKDEAVPPSSPRAPPPAGPSAREGLAALEARETSLEEPGKALRGFMQTPSHDATSQAQAAVIGAVFAPDGPELLSAHLADGTYVWASASARTLFGWRVEQLVGRTAASLYHHDDWQRMGGVDPLVSGLTGPIEVRFRTSDGSYRWVDIRARQASMNGLIRTIRFTRKVTSRASRSREFDVAAGQAGLDGLDPHSEGAQVPSEREMLRLCAWCKAVGDEWLPLDRYLETVTRRRITHGICPACVAAFDQAGFPSATRPRVPGSES